MGNGRYYGQWKVLWVIDSRDARKGGKTKQGGNTKKRGNTVIWSVGI